MYEMISDPGRRPYPPGVALALRTPGWGVGTVRDGVDPEDQRFRPRFLGVADVWDDSRCGEGPSHSWMTLTHEPQVEV